MFGRWDKVKRDCMVGYEPSEKYYRIIQLSEDKESGEIIDNYYLVLDTGKHLSGRYVRTIDIRALEVFSTDINYDDRVDLIKLSDRHILISSKDIILKSYMYK